MITSNQNPKVKLARALLGRPKERQEAGAFVIEGVRLLEEAIKANWPIRYALYDESLNERGRALVESLSSNNTEMDEIPASLMGSLSQTEAPQGILAVSDYSAISFPDALHFILIPDQIRDPGNLGTLLRTADAAGVQAVLLPPETTDAFAPKVMRAGMGAHFRLPIRTLAWEEIEKLIRPRNIQVFLADMDGRSCWETDLRQPLALIIGGEAEGASKEAHKMANQQISIPMQDGPESLNAAVAGSILMIEVMRQRWKKSF
jgi:RNA methyltransferase, TrmH family